MCFVGRLRKVPNEAIRLTSLFLVAAGAIVSYGEFTNLALILILLGFVFLVLSFLGEGSGAKLQRRGFAVAAIAMSALAAFDVGQLARVSFPLVAVVVLPTLGLLSGRRWLRRGALALSSLGQVLVIVTSWDLGPRPLDVMNFLQGATQRLLGGLNPYGTTTPLTPYTGYHGPAAVPFDYGPAAVLNLVPGRWLGDVRLMQVVFAVLFVVCVGFLAPDGRRWKVMAMTALLPLTLPMILYGFVDLPPIALFALWLLVREKKAVLAAAILGLALAGKPSAAPVLLVMFVWLPADRRRILAGVAVTALIVVPFALWTGLGRFYQDVVSNLAAQPPRLDSLTLEAFLHSYSLPLIPGFVSIFVVGITTLLVLSWRPRDLSECLLGGGIIAMVIFLFAKVAYLNYYYTVAAFIILAVAAAGRTDRVEGGWWEGLVKRVRSVPNSRNVDLALGEQPAPARSTPAASQQLTSLHDPERARMPRPSDGMRRPLAQTSTARRRF